MPARKPIDPAAARAAVVAVGPWLRDRSLPAPARAELAAAVRLTARTLEDVAPGNSVEVRVPPFVAVQCIEGPRHTRGTPPNVVETDPRSWLLLVVGAVGFDDLVEDGTVSASGSRAGEVAHWMPLVPLDLR
ncbi:sterol carrier family protein [Gordonia sp. NB41Y]|uniref:sterol carrier family protein n=1 Tax=Gordonia sp. NB41Y TaxID=875808 RepID=UPI0016518CDB|nr:sterol carrier family protein [Gordonia sp. NB41Y]WLP89480.1 sterol carrier family protein [Gordonia sp. NB41Y]